MKINGKDYSHNTIELKSFLEEHGIGSTKIVIEVNGEILKKNAYSDYIIQKDDIVEIVAFVGGG
jgi:sulfur carrier protein